VQQRHDGDEERQAEDQPVLEAPGEEMMASRALKARAMNARATASERSLRAALPTIVALTMAIARWAKRAAEPTRSGAVAVVDAVVAVVAVAVVVIAGDTPAATGPSSMGVRLSRRSPDFTFPA